MKTYIPKESEIEKKWYVIDAEGKTLGRLASSIATILRGKHKPYFTPHMDVGDFVVVINAEKVHVTGKKAQQKFYFRHTGYPGGAKLIRYDDMQRRHPDRIITHAVWGMLPHNRLGRKLLKKLKVYAGPDHPHQAQKPEPLEINT